MTSILRTAKPCLVAIFSIAFSVFSAPIFSQNGCPGCSLNLPPNLPADTIFLQNIPNGLQNAPFDADISFRMPKTTTPVHAADSTIPAGLPISEIKILSVTGLPPGLDWTPSQTVFQTASQTDGCIKICGTPLAADSFFIEVSIEATVFFIHQTTSFLMKMYVKPAVSSTAGFSMTGFESCGPTTVYFKNNVPSGGAAGFKYDWNFGNGQTSIDENPQPQTYVLPGTYVVKYKATIDTAAHNLLSVKVLSVGCSDTGLPPLFSTAPDLYINIRDENGVKIYFSGTAVTNATLPLVFPLNLKLEPSKNYTIEVWDEDSAFGGTDDNCGIINFTTNAAGDTLQNGALRVSFQIFHPVSKVESSDTVRVFQIPEQPVLEVFPAVRVCEGDTIRLFSSQNAGNQWFRNGQKIVGATDSTLAVTTAGAFHVVFTTPDGCSATSDTTDLSFKMKPAPPVFYNNQNVLTLLDPSKLPASYTLNWFLNDSLIGPDTNFDLCAAVQGVYALEVTDLATGCSNRFETLIVPNPNFDCSTAVKNELISGENEPFSLLPNPTTGELWIFTKNEGLGLLEISVFTLGGARLGEEMFANGDAATGLSIDLSSLPDGLYLLKIKTPDGRVWVEKVVLNR